MTDAEAFGEVWVLRSVMISTRLCLHGRIVYSF